MNFTIARMMAAAIPEEVLLEKAIEALQKYKEEKFSNKEEKTSKEEKPTGFAGLKSFLSKSSKEEEKKNKPNIKKPEAELSAVMMKWRDEGLSMDEIIEDSMEFESKMRRFDNDNQ